ncbi:MAG TPA: 5-(carboxyamino)imidazole ribonucleotide synthase [bacterium]|nr:5-(carboxyamino)imidazole ribonucleotide synthase [bacterium]
MSDPILPGSTIGVLGSGQLGRMFAIAARQMGYRVHTLSPADDTPTGQVSDREVRAEYGDLAAVREFASRVDVVTFEFENVPAGTAAACAELVPVRPAGSVLHTTQNRLREKTFLQSIGIPTAPFMAVRSLPELEASVQPIGLPAVLKTAGWGYDGKGQRVLRTPADLPPAWESLQTDEAILEGFIDFTMEVSFIQSRGLDERSSTFGPIENIHSHHILDLSVVPARVPDPAAVLAQATPMCTRIAEALGLVGVLCIECFVTRDGQLLVNELAPRPHNSGHLTIDACVTSQFEQQLRAICGLPLGAMELLRPAAMANLLGDGWGAGGPDWAAALQEPHVKLHLYGKSDPRPGRKMGHLTALGNTAEDAVERVLEARGRLRRSDPTRVSEGASVL